MRFGDPQAGWLPVDLLLHGRPASFAVSYTPNDALLDFIQLLRAGAQGGGPGACVWHCEPEEVEFTITGDGERLRLEGVRWPSHLRTEGSTMLLVKTGSVSDIVVPLWRSLCDLEGRWQVPEFDRAWGRVFPSDAMRELCAQVRSLEAPPNSRMQRSRRT